MKAKKILPLLLPLLLLAGCMMPSGDDLLSVPRPSANYQSLQIELEKLLSSGVTYTAPLEGENRSTIQLVDLDGDGVEEAITFFRGANAATSNSLQIYIYKKTDDQYICTGSVEGNGTSIQSVEYPAITPDGRRGMVVAWKLPQDGVGALTVCDFDDTCTAGILLETEYNAMELTDLTGDGAKDLLLLTTEPSGKRVARMYQYIHGTLKLAGEAAASPETVSVERMKSGRIRNNLSAVFAEEKTASGVGLATDIFVYADGALRNLALGGEDSASMSTYRPVSVYAADINLDGVMELPRAVLMAGYTDAAAPDAVFMLDWYAYSVNEAPLLVRTTYHNVADAWTFRIDDAWHDVITASKSNENGMSTVTFYDYTSGQRLSLFSIYCATGVMRDYYADRKDLLQLGSTAKAVYFARLAEKTDSAITLNAWDIQSRFSLIRQDWSY